MIKPKFHVDLQWLNKLSYRLDLFTVKRPNQLYNCRCPICGDSKKNKFIGRFYFVEKKGSLNSYCHNCGWSSSFYKFVRTFAPSEFDVYKRETLFDHFIKKEPTRDIALDTRKPILTESSNKSSIKTLPNAVPLLELSPEHPAMKYMLGRGFGKTQLKRLLYTDDFKLSASVLNAESTEKLMDKEPRIIIPFYNDNNEIVMLQGRSMQPKNKMKYITIKRDSEVEKVYGLEEFDPANISYGVEGPLDSLFVENCLAKCDADLKALDVDVLIYDNQPRNKEVVALMSEAITDGRSIVIWPNSPNGKQDINDLIKLGVTPPQLMRVLKKRTFKGLLAKLEFEKWKKV